MTSLWCVQTFICTWLLGFKQCTSALQAPTSLLLGARTRSRCGPDRIGKVRGVAVVDLLRFGKFNSANSSTVVQGQLLLQLYAKFFADALLILIRHFEQVEMLECHRAK